MKKILNTIKILVLLCVCSITFAGSNVNNPELFLEYGIAMDHLACNSDRPITKDMEEELSNLIPTFKNLWQQNGPILLTSTSQLLGKNFEFGRKEVTLNFLLCGNISSMSFPLIINARGYLKSADKDPYPAPYFVDAVFHELIHRYLWQNFQPLFSESVLLKKYQNETDTVKFHLHLMALIKYIYLSLHKEAELQEIIKNDSQSKDSSYARSWEIINDVEGYKPFIDELKRFKHVL